MNNLILLSDRSIIELEGIDRKSFLQGLISNDVNKASQENLIYAAMLGAQGRFLYDFFIFENGEKLMLDCFAARRDEIIQKLNFYKLRSKVVIKKNDELQVFFFEKSGKFIDPRNSNLGYRTYLTKDQKDFTVEKILYDFKRISLKIPESEADLTYDKSFILEFGFDDLNAIDYQKGCYVGQELTARTHYLGQIRKKIFHVKIDQIKAIEKNAEITCEGKSVGIILSSVFFQSELHALALIKLAQDQEFSNIKENLQFSGQKIFVVS
ncbi:MAG: folate-binding protein [Proteobacteria bacterium]|nr:folate-binding protein [Pseudomonadota bacterium]